MLNFAPPHNELAFHRSLIYSALLFSFVCSPAYADKIEVPEDLQGGYFLKTDTSQSVYDVTNNINIVADDAEAGVSISANDQQTITFTNNQSISSNSSAFVLSDPTHSLVLTNNGTISGNEGSGQALQAHSVNIVNNGNWTDLSEQDPLFSNKVINVSGIRNNDQPTLISIENTGLIHGGQVAIAVATASGSVANELNVTINNSGTIIGNSGNEYYAPILLNANGMAGGVITAIVSNTGTIINNAPDSDIELLISGNDISSKTSSVTIGTYHLTPKAGYIWRAQNNGVIKFDKQTHLILIPNAKDGFVENKTVAVSDILTLVDGWNDEYSVKGQLDGKLSSNQISSLDPIYGVIFVDATDTLNQRFGLSHVRPELSGSAQFGKFQRRAARERADRLSEILTPVKLVNNHNVWVRPYASQSRFRDENGLDIDTEGIVLGTSHRISQSVEVGAHIGYENNSWDASDALLDGDSDTLFAGIHGIYQPNDFWGIRGFVTGVWGDNEVKSQLMNDYSKNSVDSLSVMADITTYFNFPVTEHSVLRPEFGISYIHTKTDAWDTKWSLESNEYLNREFKKESYDDVFLRAKLRWYGEFETDQGAVVKPNESFGTRVMLTDNSFDSSMLFNGQYYSADIKDDSALGLVGIGFNISKDHWRFSLEGQGAYGSNTTSHLI